MEKVRSHGEASLRKRPSGERRRRRQRLDELVLDIAPVLLGSGERIIDGVTELNAEPVEVATSPLATHVVYRISSSVGSVPDEGSQGP